LFQRKTLGKLGSGDHRLARDLTNGRPILNVHTLEAAGELPFGASRIVVAFGQSQQVLQIARLPGTRGGDYALWLCGCGKRRRHLYLKDGRWACRSCHSLHYASRHDSWSPPMRRAAKLRARMGGAPLPFGDLPPRPRRYPQNRHYDKLLPHLLAAEAAALARLGALNEAAEERQKGQRHDRQRGADDPK
jgi:hypothetical protein